MLIEDVIVNQSFPIAVVIYLLYDRSRHTDKMTKALYAVEKVLIKLEAKIDGKI